MRARSPLGPTVECRWDCLPARLCRKISGRRPGSRSFSGQPSGIRENWLVGQPLGPSKDSAEPAPGSTPFDRLYSYALFVHSWCNESWPSAKRLLESTGIPATPLFPALTGVSPGPPAELPAARCHPGLRRSSDGGRCPPKALPRLSNRNGPAVGRPRRLGLDCPFFPPKSHGPLFRVPLETNRSV
ncbi:MAG: hypothetical protein Ct9H300mP1_25910 [Planctomycetaceae bacterium]|nr:MAG: hypothetical protein Ct9H300mP1_25910 [Planctomycetaceae bacterium]